MLTRENDALYRVNPWGIAGFVDPGRRCGDDEVRNGVCAYDGGRTSGSRCDTVEVTKVLCPERNEGWR